MIRLLAILVLIHCCTAATAQQQLCLQETPSTNSIDFRPEELNRFLQLDQYKAIFFGEQHNTRFDPQIKYHLITDLNRRTGMRHVFMELSASAAWHLNQYLQTGDTAQLYYMPWLRTSEPYAAFWTRLYAYNSRLAGEQKIVIHGVDFETTSVFPTLKQLAPAGGRVPPALVPVMDTVAAHLADSPLAMWQIIDGKFILYDNTAFERTLRYVQAQFLAHPDATKAYFGTDYPAVEDIITNDSPVEVKPNRRNRTMFAAIRRIVGKQKLERFIGFFGGQHTAYSVGNSLPNAAAGLSGFHRGDILNIAEFAYNMNAKDTAFRDRHFGELVRLNGTCKATVLPARSVRGFQRRADFVFIADTSE